MKKPVFALALVASLGLNAAVITTTNFVGTIAYRQQTEQLVSDVKRQAIAFAVPSFEVQWTTNIIADSEGYEYCVGPHCPEVIANWLAASTTNDIQTCAGIALTSNGHAGEVTYNTDGAFSFGALDTYEETKRVGYTDAHITIVEKHFGEDYSSVKWKYRITYNINGGTRIRELEMTLTLTPRWRFQQSP